MATPEARWQVGVMVDDYMDYQHQSAQQVRGLLARWGEGDDVTYVITRCDCDLCVPATEPDRCACGGTLVPDVLEPGMVPLTETCSTCGRVYDLIPF